MNPTEGGFGQTLERIAMDTSPVDLLTTPGRLFILISCIQTALRHPGNTGSSAAISREMAENLTNILCEFHPDVRPLIERGWDEAADMSREQFDLIMTNDNLYEEIRIVNASNLLQEYAQLMGGPVILAANRGVSSEEGLKVGNPAAADLEPIEGLTIAVRCNPFEAQVLVNGLSTLIAALPVMTGQSVEDDHNPFPDVNQDDPNKPGPGDQF